MSHREDFSLSGREKSLGAGVSGAFRPTEQAAAVGEGSVFSFPERWFPFLVVMPPHLGVVT